MSGPAMPGGSRYGVEVRAVTALDVAEVARLLNLSPAATSGRLEAVRAAPGAVLVATGWNALAGLAAVQWGATLDADRPTARLTTLLVDPGDRRRGIGRLLLKAASQAARAAGCEQLDVVMPTGQDSLAAFCDANGFLPDGQSVTRPLRRRGASET